MRKLPLEEEMCTNLAILVVQPFECLAVIWAGFGERIKEERAGEIRSVQC